MIPESARPLVDRLLSTCTLPAPGEPIECAVSGGPDSSALLVLAVAAGCQVTAHHVDHGLRAGSSSEAHTVRALATRFGATFVGHRVHVEPGSNLEARARDARYSVLPAGIATGHTLDDRAETVLINLVRGAGRRGLSPHRDRRRHPIINLRRSDTHELVDRLDLDIVDDASNRDARFLRNRVRHEVLPLLDDVAGRDIAALIDQQADLLGDEDDLLDSLAGAVEPTDARALTAAHPALARRAIRNWLITTPGRTHPPSAADIERVLAVARGEAVATQIGGGQRVHRREQRLTLNPASLGSSS